jgi:uncharacterized membrane protein
MRVFAGGLVGIALIAIGAITAARNFRVPAQSLCATGVLILYADIYAAYSFYNLIPLAAATAFMWMVTGVALFLATHFVAQSVAWLGVLGGFLTPALLWTNRDNPVALFGYIGVLNCGIAAVAALKRWNYLILLAAVGSIIVEFGWLAAGPILAGPARVIFLGIEALFLFICVTLTRRKEHDVWSTVATGIAGLAAIVLCIVLVIFRPNEFGGFHPVEPRYRYGADFIFPLLFFANAGLLALGAIGRTENRKRTELILIAAGAIALTCLVEKVWYQQESIAGQPLIGLGWLIAIFILFSATPYFCGVDRLWPWLISTIAGPVQFWFAYEVVEERLPNEWIGLLPIAFALPAIAGVIYLVRWRNVSLASADSRLATLGAAIVFFISSIFPVQFSGEWITLGWAIEGVGLLLLFRLIPNPRLRALALIVFCAAFVRLALNPAVFEYHPRSRVHIFNWYLYAFGIPAICFFLGARWFGEPHEKAYERRGPGLLYTFGAIVCFLLLNIEIADYFSIGPTLTFSFHGNFARDMTYTIANAVFAFALLVGGMIKNLRPLRFAAVALLCLALGKLFLHDLDSLNQLYRIGAFISVAVIAIVASFIYQRFLSPETKKS